MNLRERERDTTGQGPTCLPAVTRAGPSREGHRACAAPLVVRPGHRAAGGGSVPGRPLPPTGGSGGSALGAGSTNGSGGGAVARSLLHTGAVAVPRLGVPARRLWTTARGAQGEGGAARHGEPTGKAAEPKRRAGGTEAAEEEEAAAAVEELGLGEARRGADGREGRRWGCEAATTRRERSWPFVAGSTAGIPPDDVARREARELTTNRQEEICLAAFVSPY